MFPIPIILRYPPQDLESTCSQYLLLICFFLRSRTKHLLPQPDLQLSLHVKFDLLLRIHHVRNPTVRIVLE